MRDAGSGKREAGRGVKEANARLISVVANPHASARVTAVAASTRWVRLTRSIAVMRRGPRFAVLAPCQLRSRQRERDGAAAALQWRRRWPTRTATVTASSGGR